MAIEVVDIPYSGVNGPRRTPKQTLGKDDFLMLLTKQLQNQDPMQPMDNMQFIGQMAQFSSLEQMTNFNKSFEAFLSGFSQNYKVQAMGMLGRNVSAKLNGTPEVVTGKVDSVMFVDGKAIFKVGETTVSMEEILTIDNPEA